MRAAPRPTSPASTGASRGVRSIRLIRGCNPAPGAWTTLDGKTLQIFDIQPLPARDPKGIGGKYGEVVEVVGRRLHRRLRRRPHQGAAREARRRPQGRRRRIRRSQQSSPSGTRLA